MVDRKTEVSDHFSHAGAGTALVVTNLGAIIPGFIPILALTALVAVVLVAPFLILGLAAALIAAPPYAIWRFATRARRRRRREEQEPVARSLPVPTLQAR